MEPLNADDAQRYAEFKEWTPYEAALLLAGCKPLPRSHIPEPSANTSPFNLIHAVQICGPSRDLKTPHPPEVWMRWYSEHLAGRYAPEFSRMILQAFVRPLPQTAVVSSEQHPLAIRDVDASQDETHPPAGYEQSMSDDRASAARHRRRRKTWRDVALPYVAEAYQSGKYRTAHVFYKALINKAKAQNSPFTVHDNELFLSEIGQSVSVKTIQNAMPEIKAAAREKAI